MQFNNYQTAVVIFTMLVKIYMDEISGGITAENIYCQPVMLGL